MTIVDLNSSALMFLGVNEGYGGDSMLIQQPEVAAILAKNMVSAAKRFLHDANEYEIYPAIAIYPTSWGCMIGGESVAAIVTNGDCASAEKMARHLQRRFMQDEVTLAMFDEAELGEPTLNFHSMLVSSLKEFGAVWQKAAGEYFDKTGIYVSVGAYQAHEKIIISAQANPAFQPDFELWKETAIKVCAEVSDKLEVEINPEFSPIRQVYLDRTNLDKSAPAPCR